MDIKLFFSTFLLIFLAELGDKTQLAAMMRTATADHARWTVFSAAAAALVLSTLLAVLVGSALTKVIPEHYIRMGAAVLFVIFGVLLLRDALSHRKKAVEPIPTTSIVSVTPGGLLSRLVLRAAAEFEHAAAADYRKLADQASTPESKAIFAKLAEAESSHFDRLTQARLDHGEPEFTASVVRNHAETDLRHDVANADDPIVSHAIEHELATANFYEALANDTAIPALRRIFQSLALEERQHAAILTKANTKTSAVNGNSNSRG